MLRRVWWHVDAEEKILGRMAVQIATRLMGKNRVLFSRGADLGDFVVVTNADKVMMTGNRMNTKVYKSHTGYPGGYKETPFKAMVEKHPEKVIRLAVRRMLPKNPTREVRMKRLLVFSSNNPPPATVLENVTKRFDGQSFSSAPRPPAAAAT
ncbi:putative MRPL23-mitochondrial ribosomal protein, large subunit [Hyaloraphidium curvatum]|nr:putative MRPL23-mitochondrial ribosomal protein, large subunit [Hyaloraphidium curvatum]